VVDERGESIGHGPSLLFLSLPPGIKKDGHHVLDIDLQNSSVFNGGFREWGSESR
jgi:hypothetical protein